MPFLLIRPLTVLFLCFALGAISQLGAAQSLKLISGKKATATIPSNSTFNSVGSFTMDMRLHSIPAAGNPVQAYSTIVVLPGFVMQWYQESTIVFFQDYLDKVNSDDYTQQFAIDMAGRTDIVFRFRRDVDKKEISIETWNSDGSGYVLLENRKLNQMPPLNLSGDLEFGGPHTNLHIGYFRLVSTCDALRATPPGGAPRGNLLDYEFEGNGQDSSANRRNLSLDSGLNFQVTPLLNPRANQPDNRILRAGVRQVLDGSQSFSPNDAIALQYDWEQISGPTALQWSGQKTAVPRIDGLVFGTYSIRLTVRDSSNRQSSTTLKYGAVATDDRGVVIQADPKVEKLLGPLTRWGVNPWPYFDERHRALADRFGALQSSPEYLDVWNQPLAGTISMVQNSRKILGVGTSFKARFCGGGTQPVGSTQIVLFYPSPLGGTGRRPLGIAGCVSDTELDTREAYRFGPTASGMQYATIDDSIVFQWSNGSRNVNYYDNVLAFYSLYYRTGIDDYLTYARTLADRWWTYPYIDRGSTCDGIGGEWCLMPRLQSMTGMYLRMLDKRPDMLPGLRLNTKTAMDSIDLFDQIPAIGDVREESYILSRVALCALFDPDSAQAAACASATAKNVAKFKRLAVAPANGRGKYWGNFSTYDSSWDSQPGSTVQVTNGSRIVTGTSTDFRQASSRCAPGNGYVFAFRSTNATGERALGDNVKYYIQSIDSATQLTLDRPYAGATAGGRGWTCGTLVGLGVLPFTMGIAATTFHYSANALEQHNMPGPAADADQLLTDTADWLRQEGYRNLARGLWYGRYYVNCEPINENADPFCIGGEVEASREFAGEVINAFTQLYSRHGTASAQITADELFGGLFGKYGGPFADSRYSKGIDDAGYFFTSNNAKYFGFFFGFGFGASWPAARIGGVRPAIAGDSAAVNFDLTSVADAVGVRIQVTTPSGVERTVNCSTSPCSIPVDRRQGSHWVLIKYVLGSGAILSPADGATLLTIE